MTKTQFARERDYGAAMAIAGEMRARGLVTPEEYVKLDALIEQRHRPCIGRISTIYDRANP
ncbi:MAG: hypothetical protein LBB75_03220 [Oscillospiraceae bacterium]|jgi:hypothetical protein|nr:hypothetical protein [Oscillospiraceae bacterium]